MYWFDEQKIKEYIQHVTPATFYHLCGYYSDFGKLFYESGDYLLSLKQFARDELLLKTLPKDDLMHLFGELIQDLQERFDARENVWNEAYGAHLETHKQLYRALFQAKDFPIEESDGQWFFAEWNDKHQPIGITECPPHEHRLGYLHIIAPGWDQFYSPIEWFHMPPEAREQLIQTVRGEREKEWITNWMNLCLTVEQAFDLYCKQHDVDSNCFWYKK